ncbi:helix-turn-helix domain-containing protein [Desulfocastanea catecholica]
MRKSVRKSIMGTMVDLKEIGLVKDITMRNIESLCLPDVKDYNAADIVKLRKSTKLSQAAFAAVVNVSTSTQQKWERGDKKPSGASKRLLDVIERKGLEAIL